MIRVTLRAGADVNLAISAITDVQMVRSVNQVDTDDDNNDDLFLDVTPTKYGEEHLARLKENIRNSYGVAEVT